MRGEFAPPALAVARSGPAASVTVLPAKDRDELTRAVAALRAAVTATMSRPQAHPLAHPQDRRKPVPKAAPEITAEVFSPVGTPPPRWRAGSDRHEAAGPQSASDAGSLGHDEAATGARDNLARRITALYLPRFAIERWERRMVGSTDAPPDDLPVALAVEGAHGPVIHATNRAADLGGIRPGARVVDMRALCPDLRVEYADIGGDRAALDKLMLWARRWCPWTATDGASGLVMDTTGSDHLWGGEAEMLREIEARLSSLGFSSRLATAPTHGAAWALSRFAGVREVCAAPDLAARVAPLSVRALRLTPETVLLLTRLGLKTVGDLSAVPRLSLTRRFNRAEMADNPLLRLDQMMGRLAEPLNAPDDPPRFAVQSRLAEPVQDPVPYLPALAQELCAGLAAAGYGARRVTLTVYRTDGEVASATAAMAHPSRDAVHLARLFDGRLDRLDPGFGFDLITLDASASEKLATIQTRLDGGADDGAELARLVDRLTARFGGKTIRHPVPAGSHIPERSEAWRPTLPSSEVPTDNIASRPVRLFDSAQEVRVLYAVPEGPPAQFVWNRITHRVSRFAGPERIAPEWWNDRPGTRLRDYYQVEDHTGRRLWIFREGVLGDGRGREPRWFIHGLFS